MSLTRSDALEASRVSDVDPDIRRFHQIVSADYASFGDFQTVSLPEARRAAERVRARWTAGGPVMERTIDMIVPSTGTPIRVHVPEATDVATPALVYIHGGGWTLFSINTHDRLMREYAARSGLVTVGLEYSLAPEAKFPRQIDEIVALVEMLRSDGASFGIDPERIAIGGDSAGANLSVAANLALREAGAPILAAMLLNYGAFSPENTPSVDLYSGPDYMLTGDEMDLFWQNYVRDERDFDDPLAVPMIADLQGMPPAFIAIAECDILADGNREMAERLRQAGVDVTVASYPGTTHSFLEAVSIAKVSDKAFDDASNWLRETLS